jgi:cation transport regulator ChaC
VAFEFQSNASFLGEMLLYLRRREACEPCDLPIEIEGIGQDSALVYMYTGPNRVSDTLTSEQLAEMTVRAKGQDGFCLNYIKGIAEELAAQGIEDPAVVDLWRAVRAIA